ncbi:hypothetical protein ACVWZK_003086 [Bradyrhizobium sp. GM0.4]
MAAGGSHTSFNTEAFTVGAVSGAGILAGALAQGFQNYRAQQRDRWADWNLDQLRLALDLSESLRVHDGQQIDRLEREVLTLQADLARAEREARDAAVRLARQLPRRP